MLVTYPLSLITCLHKLYPRRLLHVALALVLAAYEFQQPYIYQY